mmetsp:Transcript_52700/g.61528  ORF Transcript_52700/g.61528 Transcript_52700/m.61528 type:complete len:89 (-) Transcript_52700:90-356(-)
MYVCYIHKREGEIRYNVEQRARVALYEFIVNFETSLSTKTICNLDEKKDVVLKNRRNASSSLSASKNIHPAPYCGRLLCVCPIPKQKS